MRTQEIDRKIEFINGYIQSENAATASKYDPNANVETKNIATLEAELFKDVTIQINRKLMFDRISKLFNDDLAKEYLRQIESHEIYVHDETSLKPYCASISLYPLLLNGLKNLGGESLPPQHIESFCGIFINAVFAISSQFAGAIATVEFLMYFDHFARKDHGENYLIEQKILINNLFQQVVYSLNQPAAARGYQSVFWNISIYDENYFNALFSDFVFPTGERPNWKSVEALQRHFMNWFNFERKKSVLTFPVITAAMLTNDEAPIDSDFENFCAEQLSLGNSFFIYLSKNPDSLASCCRLRNEIFDNTFSYSLGAGGVSTGSINVITINFNRLVQQKIDLKEQVIKIHKYQVAFRSLIEDFYNNNLLPAYNSGFISLKKQFLTIGINGMVEAAEALQIIPDNNPEYLNFVTQQLKIVYEANRSAHKEYGYMFNTEFVPAENLGVKNAKWDKSDGLIVYRECYNSYFYPVENEEINIADKFILHGKEATQYLDGGSALHLNLAENLTQKNFINIIRVATKVGCQYFCTNVMSTICNDCFFIDKRTLTQCSKCKGKNVDHATRVIGYLKRIKSFSKGRQEEHAKRFYHLEKGYLNKEKYAPEEHIS